MEQRDINKHFHLLNCSSKFMKVVGFCFILFRRWVLSGSSHRQWLLAFQDGVHWLVPPPDFLKGSANKIRCLEGACGISVGVLIATQCGDCFDPQQRAKYLHNWWQAMVVRKDDVGGVGDSTSFLCARTPVLFITKPGQPPGFIERGGGITFWCFLPDNEPALMPLFQRGTRLLELIRGWDRKGDTHKEEPLFCTSPPPSLPLTPH